MEKNAGLLPYLMLGGLAGLGGLGAVGYGGYRLVSGDPYLRRMLEIDSPSTMGDLNLNTKYQLRKALGEPPSTLGEWIMRRAEEQRR